jgi:hypothetical protein
LAGRRTVAEKFSLRAMLSAYEATYAEVLSGDGVPFDGRLRET